MFFPYLNISVCNCVFSNYNHNHNLLCPITEVATHPNINGCSSAYEWRNETNYGCLESTCIPLTVSGGCEEFHLLVEDCWAVSDKRGKLPILEVFGQSL